MSIEKIRNLREKKKEKLRKALEETSWKLFKCKGFDHTTIEDICEELDVSPRTFFRYFDSKVAVLYGDWRTNLPVVADRIKARPSDEPPMTALKEAVLELVDLYETERSRILLRKNLADASRYTGDYERNVLFPALEEVATQALAGRMAVDPEKDLRPSLYASMAASAFYSAKRIWLADEARGSLSGLVRQAFYLIQSPPET